MHRTKAGPATPAILLLLFGLGCDIGTRPEDIPLRTDEVEIGRTVMHERCATMTPTAAQLDEIERRVRRAKQRFDVTARDGIITVPVYFHVLTETSGRGAVTDSRIRAQMSVLNDAFNGATGGANVRLEFTLAGVTRTRRTTWFRYVRDATYERQLKTALKVGGPNVLNVYTARPTGGVLGWATFPWSYGEDPVLDGIVVDYETLPGGDREDYNEGDTLVHEVGHWLGLWHTFQDGCSSGDQVADTPPQKQPNWGCPIGADTCLNDGLDPIFNFMNYTSDACIYEFTPGQARRAREMHFLYRGGHSGIPRITAGYVGWGDKRRLLR